MKATRGPFLGMWLALCFHAPLVAAGLYRYSFDASTHLFLADHYRRSWFGLWEPRWFGGFSVASYPPLVHQLLALLSFPFGYDGAFALLLLLCLVAFPASVWRFAQIFVAPAAARWAAVVAVFLPGVALAAYSYGQLPTLVSLTLTLFLVSECIRFVDCGGRLRLALIVVLAGTASAAHHATPLLFFPPAVLAGISTMLLGVERDVRVLRANRAVMAVASAFIAGSLAIVPFWVWAFGASQQAFIYHPSRTNLLVDVRAQSVYVWGVYGVLPALALYGLWRRADRRSAALTVLAGVLGILGLGGTTPLPSLVFGREWQWLTYDRFALWAAVGLLPLAGIAVDRLLAQRAFKARAVAIAALALLAAYSGANAVTGLPGLNPHHRRDVHPIAQFMNAGRTAWRYQTFGIGIDAVQLGFMTPAATIDGAYYSARRLPELTSSGIGLLDAALWSDPSGRVLRQVLSRADDYSIRWAFVGESRYDSYLLQAGFAPRGTLPGHIEVWENAGAPPVPAGALRYPNPDLGGIVWGTLPVAFALLGLGVAAAMGWLGRMAGRGQLMLAPEFGPLPALPATSGPR